MITDTHVHVFPDEQAAALAAAGNSTSGLTGTQDEVRALLGSGRIGRVIAVTTAAAELARRAVQAHWPRDMSESERNQKHAELEADLLEQVRQQNAWIASVAENTAGIDGAITADPTIDAAAMLEDVKRYLTSTKVRALKIHPALSFVFPDAPGYLPIYALAQESGLPIIAHGGTSLAAFYASEIDYCAPERWAPVAEEFPDLKLVIAHLAHPHYEELASLMRAFPNVRTDLSFVLGARFLDRSDLVEVVRKIGVERVLFGSDYPAYDPVESLDYLASAGFTDLEVETMTESNAEALFSDR